MADAGFEYVPVDVKTVERAQLYVRSDPDVSREDFSETGGCTREGVAAAFTSAQLPIGT
jgi:hypothetical protein